MVRVGATVAAEGKNVSFANVDGDDWADDVPIRPPLPLDDRLWRHPSELGTHSATALTLAPPGRSMWTVALASGLVGATVAVGVMMMVQRDNDGRGRSGTAQLASVSISRQAPAPPTSMAYIARTVSTTTTTRPRPTTTSRRVVTTTSTTPPTTAPPTSMVVPVTAPMPPPQPVLMSARTASHPEPIGVVVLSGDLAVIPSGLIGTDTEAWVSSPDGVEVNAVVLGTDSATGTTWLSVPFGNLPTPTRSSAVALTAGQPVSVTYAGGVTSTGAVITEVGCSGTGLDGGQLWAMISIDRSAPPGAIVHDGSNMLGLVVAPGPDGQGSIIAPIDLLGAMEQIRRETGAVQRAWIGMSVGGDATTGPVITEVQPGSPAELAGLAVGDSVISIGGQPIDKAGRFLLLAWSTSGTPLVIELQRLGVPVAATVTPELRPVVLTVSAAPAA